MAKACSGCGKPVASTAMECRQCGTRTTGGWIYVVAKTALILILLFVVAKAVLT